MTSYALPHPAFTPSDQIMILLMSFPCLRNKLSAAKFGDKFDPDLLHSQIGKWSHGEQLCALFCLNVWNPGYAKTKGWTFDLVEFIGLADKGNVQALVNWMQHPIWP